MSGIAPSNATSDVRNKLRSSRRIALIGNPNTGKTTVFNALTGHRARVGNYAGVTVERREGPMAGSTSVRIVDLPGTYSLTALSADEYLAVELLLGLRPQEPSPEAVVVVADSANLERNLFLTTQVMEIGLPVILVLNMADLAQREGIAIDAKRLSETLGIPVVSVVAREGTGLGPLRELLEKAHELPAPRKPGVYPDEFEETADRLVKKLAAARLPESYRTRFLATRLLVENDGMIERRIVEEGGEAASEAVAQARGELAANGLRLRSLEAVRRYGWIRDAIDGCVREMPNGKMTPRAFSDRLDRVVTHRVWGMAIFVGLMALVFQAIYTWAGPLMESIESLFSWLGGAVTASMSEGPLQSLIADGVLAGVGGVMVFLPQICILFLFIAILEDLGYMSRAAFLMDRVLSRVGLSGRSFIPMMSSFACAVPGILATRTIDDSRDRLVTMLIAPLMSCSARLPVYTIFIAAFVPSQKVFGFMNLQGLVLLAMYLLGIAVAIPVTWLLKHTFFKGRSSSFVIELPPYRRPVWRNIVSRVAERAREFLVGAGTIILAVSIVIWALTYYPRPASIIESHEARAAELTASFQQLTADAGDERTAELETEYETALTELERGLQGELVRQSYLGRAGRLIEPLVEPLGWDWRIGMAAIASFPAREVIVATLGVIFDLGGDVAEDDAGLIERIRHAKKPDGEPLFTLPVALSVMVFFALCMQCAATLAAIKRESNSWKWPLLTFAYMTVLAYLGAFFTYHFFTWVL